MRFTRPSILAAAALLMLACALPARAQQRPASLRVTVLDPADLVIVGADVEVSREDVPAPLTSKTDARGTAEIEELAPGTWTLRVASPGFKDYIDSRLVLKPGPNNLTVTLRIAEVVAEVTVERDPRESATDPRGDTMTLRLADEVLDALPDTAEALQALLTEMAGPDAEISVDGFLGGELPPKERIQEIRIQRALYSADRHWGGRSRVEIITRPGTEGWRGSVGFGFSDESLNATNAFAPAPTPEQMRHLRVSMEGPLVRDRTAVSVDVDGLSAFQSEIIRAGTPVDPISGLVRQPGEELEVSIGVQHALSRLQTLRVEYRQDREERKNLGVGTFDLPERAYAHEEARKRLRVSTIGAIGKKFLNETRLEVQWSDDRSLALSDDTTVHVLDSVTFGGANVEGGRRERELTLDQKLEMRSGPHSLIAGGRFEWTRYTSDEMRNRWGTFTFSSPEAFVAGRPQTYSQRRGDPLVAYPFFTGGIFVHDDIRIHESFSLGIGLRQEWQSQVDDWWNLAPRLGFTWAPTSSGRTTVRGGLGVFHEWYEATTYEETLQVDGTRVEDISIENPGYPDPLAGGDIAILQSGRVQQDPDLEMPVRRQATLAVEHQITDALRLDLAYSYRDEVSQLRGRNVNAPAADGVRPLPDAANIVEIRSIGQAVEDEITAGASLRVPWKGLFLAARYTYHNERDDGDGATSLPADNRHPDEWGPSGDDVRHRTFLFANAEPVRNLRIGMNVRAESAPPYTITTGYDDNGDTVFNDRPQGVGRNSARADAYLALDARLSFRLGFGQGTDVAGHSQRGGDRVGGGWRGEHRVMSELYVSASNVLNTVSLDSFSGVQTSPFFLQATAARPARRIEIGTRVLF